MATIKVQTSHLRLIGLLFGSFIVGCVSVQHAQKLYADEVATFAGKPLSEARKPFKGTVGSTEPTQQRQLENGNTLHTYNSDNVNGPCNLLVEFNPHTEIIVVARAEGRGCLTPY